jgi:enterochelin esterase family protein
MEALKPILASLLFCLLALAPRLSLAQVAGQGRLASPRLRALQRELASRRRNALNRFWREIRVRGTPLVEPIEADEQNVLVTFLWRANRFTKNVAVFPLAVSDIPGNLMVRLPNSNVWYISYRTRRDARFTYRISANDSLIPFDPFHPADMVKRTAGFQPDPLNRHRIREEVTRSLVELPGAPKQHFTHNRLEVAKGHVRVVALRSGVPHERRRIWVYTPAGYGEQSEPCGLLVSFDGGDREPNGINIPTILDNMIADGVIRPLVAVLIANPDRWNELSCNPDFADYIAEKVVPWVRQRYRVASGPEKSIITGASLGGLAAVYTAMRHPETFGNVLSQSGAFWWKPDEDNEPEWLTRQLASGNTLQLRFYIEIGLLENRLMLQCNRHLRDVLQAKGYSVKYSEYNGGHTTICWRGSFSDGLVALAARDD